jgi:hypothetical protein
MKRWYLTLGALATLVLGVILSLGVLATDANHVDASANDDERAFTNLSLKGKWGFSDQATLVPPAAPEPIPVASVGILDLDGEGNCTGSDRLNVNGTDIGPRTFDTCSYSVNPDGTGSMTVTIEGESEPVSLFFVIVDKNREFRYILSGVLVGDGVAKRQ